MGWESLIDIGALNNDAVRQFRERVPVDCPRDGWPLEEGTDGTLHCQYGGHFVSRDGRIE